MPVSNREPAVRRGDTSPQRRDATVPSPNARPAAAAPSWVAEALRLKDVMDVREIARRLDVRLGDLVSELRRHGAVPGAKEHPTERPDARSGSRDGQILRHFDLLGKVPDSDVARAASVSIRTVASFRARHGIPGYDGPRRRAETRGRRSSRLEDHVGVLGVVPDRVVADLSGLSLGAVRAFRIKHNIPAAGRMSEAEIRAALAGDAAPSPIAEAGAVAWHVKVRHAGVTSDVVVVADSLEGAAARARDVLGAGHDVVALERLGPLLQRS